MKIGTVVAVALFMVYGIPVAAVGADWALVYSRSGVSFYYDKDSINDKSAGKIELDARTTFETDPIRQEIIKERRSKGMSVEGWNKLRYVVNRIELDCSLRKYNFLSGSHYDETGNLLESDNAPGTRWNPIIDGSPMMFTYNAVCHAPKR